MNHSETSFGNDSATNKNVESNPNTIKSSCGCGGDGSTRVSRTRKEIAETNPERETTVIAPEIVCGGCASSIKKALENVCGVSQVEVDVPTKKVTVKHGENVTREIIADALDRAGYAIAF